MECFTLQLRTPSYQAGHEFKCGWRANIITQSFLCKLGQYSASHAVNHRTVDNTETTVPYLIALFVSGGGAAEHACVIL